MKIRDIRLRDIRLRDIAHYAKEAVDTLHTLKTEHQYLGRYSVDKLCAFYKYQESVSIYRVVAVIVLSPLPTLLVLAGLDAFRLRDPRRPASQHATTFLRSVLSHFIMTYMFLLAGKQAMKLTASNSNYTHTKCMLISICVSVCLESFWVIIAFDWKYPVPLREFLGVPIWGTLVVVFNYVLAKTDLTAVLTKLKRYLPVVGSQMVLFYFLLALTTVFAVVPYQVQLVMMFAFPLIKLSIKRQLWKFSRELDDISADVTICMVEISGSLYQTVCMQYVQNNLMVLIIMGMDFFQALVESRTYMSHDYVSDARTTLQTAVRIAEAGIATRRKGLETFSSRESRSFVGSRVAPVKDKGTGFGSWETARDAHSAGPARKTWRNALLGHMERKWGRFRRRQRSQRQGKYAVQDKEHGAPKGLVKKSAPASGARHAHKFQRSSTLNASLDGTKPRIAASGPKITRTKSIGAMTTKSTMATAKHSRLEGMTARLGGGGRTARVAAGDATTARLGGGARTARSMAGEGVTARMSGGGMTTRSGGGALSARAFPGTEREPEEQTYFGSVFVQAQHVRTKGARRLIDFGSIDPETEPKKKKRQVSMVKTASLPSGQLLELVQMLEAMQTPAMPISASPPKPPTPAMAISPATAAAITVDPPSPPPLESSKNPEPTAKAAAEDTPMPPPPGGEPAPARVAVRQHDSMDGKAIRRVSKDTKAKRPLENRHGSLIRTPGALKSDGTRRTLVRRASGSNLDEKREAMAAGVIVPQQIEAEEEIRERMMETAIATDVLPPTSRQLVRRLAAGGVTGVTIDNVFVQRRDLARVLEQTLQLLFAAEVLLFVEYMEVFMPILYAACVGTLSRLPNAKYNVILNQLTDAQVVMEVGTSVAYAALEFVSFLSVYWFVKKRYGISALYQLAFLLETYWMTLQGKLIGCFITILNSSTIHQGIDLTFEFNVTAQLEGVPLAD